MVTKVLFYEIVISCIIISLGIIFVICSISKRGAFKFLPLKLKLSLLSWLVVSISYNIIGILCRNEFHVNECSDGLEGAIYRINEAFYLSVDWLFASHYLKMACLFRKAFASHFFNKLSAVKRWRNGLLALDIIVYTVICATSFIFSPTVLEVLFFLIMWMIALVSFFSMRHIMKLSKPLEKQGIYSNHRLLVYFAIFSSLAVLCFTAYLAIYLSFKVEGFPAFTPEISYRLRIATKSLTLLQNVFLACLDAVTLTLYLKFANQIHDMAIQ